MLQDKSDQGEGRVLTVSRFEEDGVALSHKPQ